MSLSTSLTNQSQLYPGTSSDNQWNQDLHVLENQQQYLASEQYTINPVCNGPSATYNPKIVNANHCMNSQMTINPPNYVNLYNPNGLNGQDIRYQNTYIIENPGVMAPRNGHFIPNGNNVWASSLRRERTVSRTSWNTPKATTSGGIKKSKRIRTAFTSQQMMELENEYARARYLDRSRRIELSETLKLNERTIKIWFQNRRMKEKKDKTEANEEAEATSTTESSPELVGPMPMYDPYPNNGVCDRSIYVEQYPVVSTMPQQNIVSCHVDEVNLVPNTYPMYFVDNMQPQDYELQCRQINMQLENYTISSKNEEKVYQPETRDETSTSENSTNEATAKSSDDPNGDNWDLSWIRSIQIDEDA